MTQEKRMAGDYEITAAFHIGDKEVVMGENPANPDERYGQGSSFVDGPFLYLVLRDG